MTGRLAGRVAVVTGAGSGIGRATARRFHAEGAVVVLADVTDGAIATAAELGDRAEGTRVDVRRRAEVEDLIEGAVARYGGVHVLANVAGASGTAAPLAQVSDESMDAVLEVNVKGPFHAMRAALPVMVAQGGGSIVNVASMNGVTAAPTLAPYCASKAALLMLTRAAALEYAAHNVRINSVNPGPVDTPLVRALPPAMYDQAIALAPFGRAADPGEVADVVLFLASDQASYVTAAAYDVSGGYCSA